MKFKTGKINPEQGAMCGIFCGNFALVLFNYVFYYGQAQPDIALAAFLDELYGEGVAVGQKITVQSQIFTVIALRHE